VSLLVRLRPNGPYLLFMAVAAAATVGEVAQAGPLGAVVAIAGGLLLVLFGYPVVVSTVCRVPVVAVDGDGIRLPLMGVHMTWAEVSSVKRSTSLRGRARPVLLIFPASPQAAVGQARPWLRRVARRNIARYGTPIVVSGLSLDHSVDDIAAAVRPFRRTPQA
jgi:hypothetical protein